MLEHPRVHIGPHDCASIREVLVMYVGQRWECRIYFLFLHLCKPVVGRAWRHLISATHGLGFGRRCR